MHCCFNLFGVIFVRLPGQFQHCWTVVSPLKMSVWQTHCFKGHRSDLQTEMSWWYSFPQISLLLIHMWIKGTLTCRLAGWWCSHTAGSEGKTRWRQSAASRLPWGPDPGWLMPGWVGQTRKKGWVNKQCQSASTTATASALLTTVMSLPAAWGSGDDLLTIRNTHTCQWLLLVKMPLHKAALWVCLLLLKKKNIFHPKEDFG